MRPCDRHHDDPGAPVARCKSKMRMQAVRNAHSVVTLTVASIGIRHFSVGSVGHERCNCTTRANRGYADQRSARDVGVLSSRCLGGVNGSIVACRESCAMRGHGRDHFKDGGSAIERFSK